MAALEADSTELNAAAGVFRFSEPRTSSPVARVKVNKLRIRIKLRITIRREKSTPPGRARGNRFCAPKAQGLGLTVRGGFTVN